jgi:hypothetical protein
MKEIYNDLRIRKIVGEKNILLEVTPFNQRTLKEKDLLM